PGAPHPPSGRARAYPTLREAERRRSTGSRPPPGVATTSFSWRRNRGARSSRRPRGTAAGRGCRPAARAGAPHAPTSGRSGSRPSAGGLAPPRTGEGWGGAVERPPGPDPLVGAVPDHRGTHTQEQPGQEGQRDVLPKVGTGWGPGQERGLKDLPHAQLSRRNEVVDLRLERAPFTEERIE